MFACRSMCDTSMRDEAPLRFSPPPSASFLIRSIRLLNISPGWTCPSAISSMVFLQMIQYRLVFGRPRLSCPWLNTNMNQSSGRSVGRLRIFSYMSTATSMNMSSAAL